MALAKTFSVDPDLTLDTIYNELVAYGNLDTSLYRYTPEAGVEIIYISGDGCNDICISLGQGKMTVYDAVRPEKPFDYSNRNCELSNGWSFLLSRNINKKLYEKVLSQCINLFAE